jgi:hypothetical protein
MTLPNPLAKHFRQPAIYLKLPSGGRYWPELALDIPVTGELPIYPMTTRDEIVLRTPDALMNGEGMVSVFQHCCPNIKDAWQMPSIDVDAMLIAIRIASYGPSMEVSTNCPHCKAENSHDIDLNYMLDSVRVPNYDQQKEIDGLKFTFKPLAYFEQNRINRKRFDEQKLMQVVNDSTLTEEEKEKRYNDFLQQLVDINVGLLSLFTSSITTPEGIRVTEPDHIAEFYHNAPGSMIKQLQKVMEEINGQAGLPDLQLHCDECNENYETSMEFDYTSFFAIDS